MIRTLAVGLLMAACSPEAEDSGWAPQVKDADSSSGGGDGGSTDVAAASGMSGQWLLGTDWSTCVSFGSAPIELRTRKLILVDMKHTGHRIQETRNVCSVVTTKLLGMQTTVPKEVAQGVGALSVRSTIFEDTTGGSYGADPEIQIWGAKLADELSDPMPTKIDAADPRLADTDNDGNPGATLKVTGICDIWVTQRAIAKLVGTIDNKGRITGQGLHTTEQHVLKTTLPVCGQKYTTPATDAHNRFVMTRAKDIPAADENKDGKVDCDELVKHQDKVVDSWIEPDSTRCPGG